MCIFGESNEWILAKRMGQIVRPSENAWPLIYDLKEPYLGESYGIISVASSFETDRRIAKIRFA
jgi:hypothetical protein